MQNEEFYRDSGFSTSDIIGTVAAHEGEHGTNKKAIVVSCQRKKPRLKLSIVRRKL